MQIKKWIPFLLLTFGIVTHLAAAGRIENIQSSLLKELRQGLQSAFKNEEACNALYEKVKDLKNPEPLVKGYVGAVYIARSRHVAIVDKMSTFKKGKGILEEAIQALPNNLELLFLRMTIQLNLPRFLGYKDNIAGDKKFVLDHFKSAEPPLKERIVQFVKTSGHFNASEQARVE